LLLLLLLVAVAAVLLLLTTLRPADSWDAMLAAARCTAGRVVPILLLLLGILMRGWVSSSSTGSGDSSSRCTSREHLSGSPRPHSSSSGEAGHVLQVYLSATNPHRHQQQQQGCQLLQQWHSLRQAGIGRTLALLRCLVLPVMASLLPAHKGTGYLLKTQPRHNPCNPCSSGRQTAVV
jgi:hypothetical protein